MGVWVCIWPFWAGQTEKAERLPAAFFICDRSDRIVYGLCFFVHVYTLTHERFHGKAYWHVARPVRLETPVHLLKHMVKFNSSIFYLQGDAEVMLSLPNLSLGAPGN